MIIMLLKARGGSLGKRMIMGYRDKEAFLSKHYCNLSKPSTLKQAEFNFSTSSRNSMLSGLIKEIPLSSK